ncbi:hypothetical protein [Micromonospora sp. NPDC050495]|uniref:hypothetical protein n=1 Tax=Micromonospora sp. NPDC050495 TaxID=3154936 RepID=UPI003404C391
MRDDFVDLVSRDLREVRWPEPADIRARARRRSRRTAVAAAMAVLALASASTVAVAARPGAAPTSAGPLSQPDPVGGEVPTFVLLSGNDLPVRANIELGDIGLGEPVRVDPLLETCAAENGVPPESVESRYSRSRNLLQASSAGRDGTGGMPVLAQDVYRMGRAGSAQVFADLDRYVRACASWRQTTPAERDGHRGTVSIQHSWQVTARDFAGDRSVLLRHTEAPAPGPQLVQPTAGEDLRAVVQVGDLVTVLAPQGGVRNRSVPLVDGDELRALGRTAADRMCAFASPPC